MSNHGYVKNRKPKPEFTKDSVQKVLEEIIKSKLNDSFKLEYFNGRGDKSMWGKDVWAISWINGYGTEEVIECWLKSNRTFEMHHGHGSHFAWWIDTTILNEIAVAHDAIISDDGCEEKEKGIHNKYPKYVDYIKMMSRYGGVETFNCYYKHDNETPPAPFRITPEEAEQAIKDLQSLKK